MKALSTAVLLASIVLLQSAPARAALGDCTDAAYLGRFPDAPSAPDLLCVELFRFTVPTPGGERTIRGIHDASADWAFLPGAPAAVERGARLAAEAFGRLGDHRIDDVTLLLLDSGHATHWSGDRRPVLAITDGRGSAAAPGECLITLYMLGDGGNPGELAVNVAHEILHCLQFATLTDGQMATVGVGGDWWIEGSAEYFAALAVPDSLPTTDRSGLFDSAVELGTALNGMGHEAVIFFYWLHGERGPGGLVPFMRKMAADGSAPAQHAVMRGELSDEDWLRFAQAYADRNIGHPQGGLTLSPPDGPTLVFAENGTQEFPLPPFVIAIGNAEYRCGRWRNTLSPEDANVGTREADGSGWSAWPQEVDARDAPPARYRVVALHTDSAEATLSIEAERTASCEPCGSTDRLDACLVGTWVMSGGGPGEWMRAMGLPITSFNSGPRVVTFRDDGLYGAEPVATQLTGETADGRGEAEGSAAAAAGRWSAADGTLTICQDSGGVSGTVTVTTRYDTMRGPVSAPGAGELVQSYSCLEGSLSTSLPMPGTAPMETQYSRVPDPATEER